MHIGDELWRWTRSGGGPVLAMHASTGAEPHFRRLALVESGDDRHPGQGILHRRNRACVLSWFRAIPEAIEPGKP